MGSGRLERSDEALQYVIALPRKNAIQTDGRSVKLFSAGATKETHQNRKCGNALQKKKKDGNPRSLCSYLQK